MPLGSWPLLTRFGEEYYYASVSRAACTLNQPMTGGTDTPSRYIRGLRLHNGCMGPNDCQGQKVFAHQQKKGFLRVQQWLRPDASVAP